MVNAAILPKMLATADLVDRSIAAAGVTAPLMVMRCDGGVMSLDEMRGRPLLTVLSGPAAGVAGALMRERVSEGVFLETGGTSTDISVVRRGKVAVRHATILGRSSYLSALDVRTVGVGGGSMARISGGKVHAVGPRSAHIAGLPYACYADPADLAGARLVTVRPLEGDPRRLRRTGRGRRPVRPHHDLRGQRARPGPGGRLRRLRPRSGARRAPAAGRRARHRRGRGRHPAPRRRG